MGQQTLIGVHSTMHLISCIYVVHVHIYLLAGAYREEATQLQLYDHPKLEWLLCTGVAMSDRGTTGRAT